MARSPAFQLHVADFRQDPKTIRMTTVEIGAYFLLLMECWDKDNALTSNLEDLADIARLPLLRFEKLWIGKMERCFILDEKSQTYSHKRIAKEIRKQDGWSKVMSAAGKKGAAKRWANKKLNGQAMLGHSHPIASDSPTDKNKNLNTHTQGGDWAWPMKPLIDAFPEYLPDRVTPAMIGFIETAVHPGDELAWARTIETYQMNFNPATKSYLPEKTANLLSVFEKQKASVERMQHGKPQSNGYGNKRTDADVLAESADFYANYDERPVA